MSVSATAGSNQMAVLRFDPAAIKAAVGSQSLYSAKLQMTVLNFHSGWNGGEIAAHRMKRTWTERSGSKGATWRCATDANVSNGSLDCAAADRWGMNPGDPDPLPYETGVTDTVRVHSDGVTTYLNFDVTADVRALLSGGTYHGWMLRALPGGVVGTQVDFSTRQGGSPPTLLLEFGKDLCPNSASKVAPEQCGCDVLDVDTDHDGVADCREPSLTPSADSSLWRARPHFNDGIGIMLGAATTGWSTGPRSSSGPERTLIRFDDSEITEATGGRALEQAVLELTVYWRPTGWNGGVIDLLPMNRDWQEGIGVDIQGPGSTWACASDTNTSNTTADCPSASLWNMERDPKPFGAAPVASAALRDADTTLSFDVTADVKKLLDGSRQNRGWILIPRDGPGNPGWVYFASGETETPPRLRLVIGQESGRLCDPNAANACADGWECRAGVGDRFGRSTSTPVCWPPVCDDFESEEFKCGKVSDLCGTCPPCDASCSGKTCGSDGCWGGCGICGDGQPGCGRNAHCATGLTCGRDVGAAYGFDASTNVCWPSHCDTANPCSDPWNANAQTECGKCPACIPNCTNRCDVDDGCGGTCPTPTDRTCVDGQLLPQPVEPDPERPVLETPTSEAGGIGGQFGVSHAGRAEYRVPLQTPPGRAGLKPSIALSYNSAGGNGLLGVGWALEGLSSIARCNKTIASDGRAAAVAIDEADRLCLDGQRLIERSRTPQAGGERREYYTEGGASLLVTGIFNPDLVGSAYFTVRTSNGQTLTYGRSPDSVLSFPEGALSWSMSRVEDRSGNFIEYEYDKRDFVEADRVGSIHRIKAIRYTLHPSDRTARSFVLFDWEPRPDPMHIMRVGHELRADERLKAIRTLAPGGVSQEYRLTYRDEVAGTQTVSELVEVQQCVAPSVTADSTCRAVPIRLDYEQEPSGAEPPVTIRADNENYSAGAFDINYTIRSVSSLVLDANGDGKDDLLVPADRTRTEEGTEEGQVVQLRDTVWYLLLNKTAPSTGGVRATPAYEPVLGDDGWPEPALFAAGTDLMNLSSESDPAITPEVTNGALVLQPSVGDYDNDGRSDVFYRSAYFGAPLAQAGIASFDDQGHVRHTRIDSIPWTEVSIPSINTFIDLNGDGLVDRLFCDAFTLQTTPKPPTWGYQLYGLSTDTQRYEFQPVQALSSEKPCPKPHEPALSVYLLNVDWDGDGDQELVDREGGAFTACDINLQATSGEAITCVTSPVHALAQPIDLNGDGLLDYYRFDQDCARFETACVGPSEDTVLTTWTNTGRLGQFTERKQVMDAALWPHDILFFAPNRPVPTLGSINNHIHTSTAAYYESTVTDVDGDGRQDIVIPGRIVAASGPGGETQPGHWFALLSKAGGFEEASLGADLPWNATEAGPVPSNNDMLNDQYLIERPTLADVDGDGVRDLIKPALEKPDNWVFVSLQALYLRDTRPRLTEIIDGLGERKSIEYVTDADTSFYASRSADSPCAYPQLCMPLRQKLVSRSTLWDLVAADRYAPAQRSVYAYTDGRMDRWGRGFLGFAKRFVMHSNAQNDELQTRVEYTYDNQTRDDGLLPGEATPRPATNLYPFAGRPGEVTTTFAERRMRSTTTYGVVRSSAGGLRTVTRAQHIVQEEARGNTWATLTDSSSTTTPDEYGNPSLIVAQLPSDGQRPAGVRQIDLRYKYQADPSAQANPALRDLVIERKETLTYEDIPGGSGPRTQERVTRLDYDGRGRLNLSEQEPASAGADHEAYYLRTTHDEFDAFGNALSVTVQDASGVPRTTKTVFDPEHYYPRSITNAKGHPTQVHYDVNHGLVSDVTDANGSSVRTYYDLFGRPVHELDGIGGDTQTTYAQGRFGQGLETSRQRFRVDNGQTAGAGSVELLDEHARIRSGREYGFDGKELNASFEYDAMGRVITSVRPHSDDLDSRFAQVSIDAYDGMGRELSRSWVERDTDGERTLSTQSCYRGLSACRRDAEGYTSCIVQDAVGRTVKSYDPAPDDPSRPAADRPSCEEVLESLGTSASEMALTQYVFNEQLEQVIDPLGNSTRIVPDRHGRKVQLIDPNTGTHGYTYNGYGELTGRTDGNGHQTEYEYDALGRQVLRREVGSRDDGSDGITQWFWDMDGARNRTGDEFIGALSMSLSDDGHTTEYGYNPAGQLSRTTQVIGGQVFTTTQTHDAAGFVESMQYPVPTGATPVAVRYSYDDFGQVREVAPMDLSQGPYWTLNSTNFYDQVESETFGDMGATGAATTRDYDTQGRTQNIATQSASGSALQDLSYRYSPRGDLVRRTSERPNGLSLSETITYDHLSRIASIGTGTQGDRDLLQNAPSYDAVGTLQSRDDVGTFSPAAGHPYAVGSVEAVGGGATTYEYDAGGNRTAAITTGRSAQTIRSEYTRLDQPRATWREGSTPQSRLDEIRYEYDADGARVLKRVQTQGGPSRTFYAGLYERRELSGGGVEHAFMISDGARVVAQLTRMQNAAGQFSDPVVQYLHRDVLGSTDVVSGPDESVEERSFDAWGNARNPNDWKETLASAPASSIRIGFTGHEDDSFGLVNMAGRIYDPRVAQFTSSDPFVSAPFYSQSLNRYSYVWNNPLTLVDPTGFEVRSVGCQFSFSCVVLVFNEWEQYGTRSRVRAGSTEYPATVDWESPTYQISAQQFVLDTLRTGFDFATGVMSGANPLPNPASRSAFGNENAFALGQLAGAGLGLLGDIAAGAAGAAGAVVTSPTGVGVVAGAGVVAAAGSAAAGHGNKAAQALNTLSKGGGPSAPRAGANPKSVKEFGHTFSTHGAGSRNTEALRGRAAGTGTPQGQWSDNKAAAEFLRGVKVDGPATVRIPEGLGQVIRPDGSVVPADWARVIPSSTGIRTAFPVLAP